MAAGAGTRSRQFCGVAAMVVTPTQTGLGERTHLISKSINLDLFVTEIANVIKYEELNDIVLVGHSFGGNALPTTCAIPSANSSTSMRSY
jgi:hypothetical protein